MLLAALLLTAAVGASAEKIRLEDMSKDFDIELTLPEGASVLSTEHVSDNVITTIAKEGVASVRCVVSPSEMYDATQSLANLPKEEKEALKLLVGEQYANPTYSLEVTPSGNEYYMVSACEGSDVHVAFTLYMGWFMELSQWNDDYATLDQDDMDFMLDLWHGLWVVPVK